MQQNKWWVGLAFSLAFNLAAGEPAAAPVAPAAAAAEREVDFAARRMLDKARELLQSNESERAVKMVETLLDQYPKSAIRYQAYLVLGRHYIDSRAQAK